MRPFPFIACLLLLALTLAPSSSASTADQQHGPVDLNVALQRFRTAHETQRDDARSQATAYLVDRIVPHSLVPTEGAERAWHENLSRTRDDALAPYAAEAILVQLVYVNVNEALRRHEPAAVDTWMRLAYDRTTRDGWSISSWSTTRAEALHTQNVTKDLHAVLASRVHETLVTALLLEHAGWRRDAHAAAEGAKLLLDVFAEDAAARLPDVLAGPFLANATKGRALLAELPAERSADVWAGLLAPLVALELDRTVEPLDVFAMRNVDAASAAARSAAEAPRLRPALVEQAWRQYAADRPGLYLRGEGGVQALDEAYGRLHGAGATADGAHLQELANQVRTGLTTLALLERGIVLKVETGGVRPDRVHEYGLTLVRPPLEGIARYRVEIAYDPAVVAVTDVVPPRPPTSPDAHHPRQRPIEWKVQIGDGKALLEVAMSEPLRASALVAKLRLEGRGAAGSESGLAVAVAAFEEADGEGATIFRLRDGHVTVATIPVAEAVGEAPGVGPVWWGVAGLLLVLAQRSGWAGPQRLVERARSTRGRNT